jgi:hypothetical protein
MTRIEALQGFRRASAMEINQELGHASMAPHRVGVRVFGRYDHQCLARRLGLQLGSGPQALPGGGTMVAARCAQVPYQGSKREVAELGEGNGHRDAVLPAYARSGQLLQVRLNRLPGVQLVLLLAQLQINPILEIVLLCHKLL